MTMLLQVRAATKSFGGVVAARDVDLDVARGELRGIIGPNGAGKSTLFNLVSGHLRLDSGSITLDGQRIDRLAPHVRARRGVSIVFQGARVFPAMTVLENVMVGAHARTRAGIFSAALRLPAQRAEERRITAAAHDALERVGLADWADRPATDLPLGQQRRMQVARSLAAEPTVLLLDEPASGLRADEREDFAVLVEQLKETGTTILLVEHDVALVMRLADSITVLDLGEVIAEGKPDEIRADQRVIDAYLGAGATHAHS
ncbi:MAG: branched-chain amino acid transport system ATP-binding protein [Nocardioidaceae bacterium]|jgi:branched-chain amino acid transport system ATP-binding protein|nr:branched-chain amino acid transport system ATP-binding protein [Nocardioidaceae bacterium]